MTLSLQEVKHIAELARLELGEAELEHYREQLSRILEYAQRLQEVDTSSIQPTSSVLPARSVLRDDIPKPGLGLETLMQNAPNQEGGQFKVPPILDMERE